MERADLAAKQTFSPIVLTRTPGWAASTKQTSWTSRVGLLRLPELRLLGSQVGG